MGKLKVMTASSSAILEKSKARLQIYGFPGEAHESWSLQNTNLVIAQVSLWEG